MYLQDFFMADRGWACWQCRTLYHRSHCQGLSYLRDRFSKL